MAFKRHTDRLPIIPADAKNVMGAPRATDPTGTVTWSARAVDAETGDLLLDDNSDAVMPCASIGKILLLLETARRFNDGTLAPDTPLTRHPDDAVGDSGIWQDLRISALPATDVAALVGAVSDNLATNVLLRAVGLEAVAATAQELDLGEVSLHDKVRDARGAGDAPHFATANARALVRFFSRLHRDELVSPSVSRDVRSWLAANADLSIVSSAWGLDPLAHRASDSPRLRVVNKTGTDAGVRAEAGLVSTESRTIAYAVLARWPSAPENDHARAVTVLARMRQIGAEIMPPFSDNPH